MSPFRIVTALILALGLSACASYDLTTRNSPADPAGPDSLTALSSVQVVETRIVVPRSLQVSEANSYFPTGDIVWRGDAHGDRHAQIEAILKASMAQARADHRGSTPAVVEITLRRFHALTEKARYSVGGVHSVRFDLTFRDPRTGAALAPTRTIRADLREYGGTRAIQADQQGLTQKVRITRHLANVLRAELERPGSTAGNRGITQLVAGLETKAPI